MALSEARINYIRSNAQKIARNKDVSKLVRAMRICNHLVNTSGLNALGLGTLIHGGGFFYLYKIWWGLLFAKHPCAVFGHTAMSRIGLS